MLVCLGHWLDEELTRIQIDDTIRRLALWMYNRYSRSDEDLFELAAQVMNDAMGGKIDPTRKPHRRWG